MPIEFHCPSCQRLLKTPDGTAGKKGKCPHCQSLMQIPASSTAGASATSSRQPLPSQSAQPSAPANGKIEFHCPSCNRLLKTPPQTAGKQGKCPHCGGLMQIPMQSTAAAQDSGLAPLGDSSGLSPLGDSSGLSPLGSGGGANDLLDDLPALAPPDESANINPLGGGAALPDFKPLPESKTLPASTNPYASPSPASAQLDALAKASAGKRKGLPWDREQSASAFFETFKMVLLEPGEAFRKMKRSEGMNAPVVFAVFGALIGGLFNWIYGSAFLIISAAAAGGEDPELMTEVVVSVGGNLVGAVTGAVCGATVGLVISAGITHLCLMMVGGANHPYQTTLHVVAYIHGATIALQVIPCVGAVAWIYTIILMIIGLSKAHETTPGKAALAVFMPLLFCALLVGGIVAAIVVAFGAAAQG